MPVWFAAILTRVISMAKVNIIINVILTIMITLIYDRNIAAKKVVKLSKFIDLELRSPEYGG